MTEDGQFGAAIARGEFVVTAECKPPCGAAVDRLKTCAATLGRAVHAISVPESEDGPRLSSLAACAHLAAAGVEPILHLLTRDLNRIALQSAILGASSLGIRNVLCLTGRHQTLTTSSSARGVFDLDQIQLLRVADGMRKEGRFADGRQMDSPIELLLGTDTNPFGDPMELQVLALEKAAAAGADFVMTQPVFNMNRFEEWMTLVRERGIHSRTCVIASVMPLTSRDEASALAESRRYLDIPAEIIERLDAADPRAAGIEMAVETVSRLRKCEGVRGIHLLTGEDVELAESLLKQTGLSRS